MANQDLTSSVKRLIGPAVSDVEIILSGANLLDDHLEVMLRSALFGSKDDIEYLTRTSAKKRILARAIGLLSQAEAQDYKLISRIRNAVAHSHIPLTFEDTQINGPAGNLSHFHEWRDEALDLRSIYIKTVFVLANRLNRRLAAVKQVKR